MNRNNPKITWSKSKRKATSLTGRMHGSHSTGSLKNISQYSEPLNSITRIPAALHIPDEFEIDSVKALTAFISGSLDVTGSRCHCLITENDCKYYFSSITQSEDAKIRISDIQHILNLPYPHPDKTLPQQFSLAFIGHGEEELIKICNEIAFKTLVFFNGSDPMNFTIQNPNVLGPLWIQQSNLELLIAQYKQRLFTTYHKTDPQLENIKKEFRAELATEFQKLRAEMATEHQKLREECEELRNGRRVLTIGQENLRIVIQELKKKFDEFIENSIKH